MVTKKFYDKINYDITKSTLGAFEFILPNRYTVKELLGHGSFGAVAECYDNLKNRSVAIKKIQNIVDAIDLKRVIREIMILKNLRHENIIALYDVIFIKSIKRIGDVYLVFEKMDTDLFKIVSSKQPLSVDHYKYIMYQILRAILFMHSANILHRDIKPSNILINEDCTIKLWSSDNSPTDLTEYVVTRFYRAPEVMLCSHQYSKAIDIWSAGCCLGELVSKKYLFPGENYLNQIKVIIELLGSVPSDDLEFIKNENAKNFVKSFVGIKRKNLSEVLNFNDEDGIDLLSKMIVFNPDKRLSVEECLNHPYIKSIKEDDILDPIFKGNINFDFETNENVDNEFFILLLIKEISDYDTGLLKL